MKSRTPALTTLTMFSNLSSAFLYSTIIHPFIEPGAGIICEFEKTLTYPVLSMDFDFSWPGERFVKELKNPSHFFLHACLGMLNCTHLPGNSEHNIFLFWVLQWPWISTLPASSTLAFLVSNDSTGSVSEARIWEPSHMPESAKMKSSSSLCKCISLFLFQCDLGLMKRGKN